MQEINAGNNAVFILFLPQFFEQSFQARIFEKSTNPNLNYNKNVYINA